MRDRRRGGWSGHSGRQTGHGAVRRGGGARGHGVGRGLGRCRYGAEHAPRPQRLEFLEDRQGAEVGALEAGDVLTGARDAAFGVAFAASGGIGVTHAAIFGAVIERTAEREVDEGGLHAGLVFDGLHAGDFPFIDDQLLDEIMLGEGGGLPFGVEIGGEGFETGGILDGEEDAAGAKSVAEGVLGDASLAFGGARAGGFLGVGAIHFNFDFRCHGMNTTPPVV